ncbi:hypothetical protein KGQ20_38515 [Catenulispora sp. NF23]|uniref:WXG100-like domain-containing protein n=1 Tax=Catenulispora pinistramenti TaxID=2705254 RepID=UPI001BAC17F7|nr:hypothetical protein [Catenulispora pinistramenti]MBS2538657.1 hypothetical protein [Catenulispora pinistramenti]
MTTEVPAPVQWLLAIVCGQEWPDGDEQALRAAGQAWTDAATALQPAFTDADTAAKKAASSYGGTASEAFTKYWNMFTQPQGDQPAILDALVKQCQDIGQELDGFADEVETSRIEIIGQLVILAVEIAIAQSLAPLTFGLSELSIAGEVAASRLVVRELLEAVLKAAFKAALKMTVQMTALDLLAQGIEKAQGHRTSIDWGEVGKTAEGAAISGAFAGALGGVLGKAAEHTPALRSALSKPFGKVASNAAIGVGSTILTDVATGQAIDGHGLLDAALGGIGGAAHEHLSQRAVHVLDDRIPEAAAVPVPVAEVPVPDPPAPGGGSGAPAAEPAAEQVADGPAVSNGPAANHGPAQDSRPVEAGHPPSEARSQTPAEPAGAASGTPDILSVLNGGAHSMPEGHFLSDPLSRPLPVSGDPAHEPVEQPVQNQHTESSPTAPTPQSTVPEREPVAQATHAPEPHSTVPEREPVAQATHAPEPSPGRSGDTPTGPRMSHEAAARALLGVDDATPLTADQKARFDAAMAQRTAQSGARDGVMGLVDQLRGRTPGTLLQDESPRPPAVDATSQAPGSRPESQAVLPQAPTRAVLADERPPAPVVQPPIIEALRANRDPAPPTPNRETVTRPGPQSNPRPESRTATSPEPRPDRPTESEHTEPEHAEPEHTESEHTEPEHAEPERTDPQEVIESTKDDITERALRAVAARHGLVLGGSRAMARYGLTYRRTDDIDLIATGGHDATHGFSDEAVGGVREALTEAGYVVTVKPSQSGAELTVRRDGFSTTVDMTSTPLLRTYEPPVEVGGLRTVSPNDAVRMKYSAFKAAAGDPEPADPADPANPANPAKLAKQLADVHAIFAERGDNAFVLDGINPAEEKDVFRGMLGKALGRVTDDDLAGHGLSPEQIARLRADLADQAARRELAVPAAPVVEPQKPSAADVQAVLKMLYPDNPLRGLSDRRVAKATAIAARLRGSVSFRQELSPAHLELLVRNELDEKVTGTLSKDQRDRLSGLGRSAEAAESAEDTHTPADSDSIPSPAAVPASIHSAAETPGTVADEPTRTPAGEAPRSRTEDPAEPAPETAPVELEAVADPAFETEPALETGPSSETPAEPAPETGPSSETPAEPALETGPSSETPAEPASEAPPPVPVADNREELAALHEERNRIDRQTQAWNALTDRALRTPLSVPDLLKALNQIEADTGLTVRDRPGLAAALRTTVPPADVRAVLRTEPEGPLRDLADALATPFDRTLGAFRDGPARGLTDGLLDLVRPAGHVIESDDPLTHLVNATHGYFGRVAESLFERDDEGIEKDVRDLRRGRELLDGLDLGSSREMSAELDRVLKLMQQNADHPFPSTAQHGALMLRLNATMDHFLSTAELADRQAVNESRFRRTAITGLKTIENGVRGQLHEEALPLGAVRYDDAFGTPAEVEAFHDLYATEVPNGVLLGDPRDEKEADHFPGLKAYAGRPDRPDQFLVGLHGSSRVVEAGHDLVSPRELARVILGSAWDGEQPIRLHSCDTGRLDDGFAKQLARELGVQVVAPSDLAWSSPVDGDVWVTPITRETGVMQPYKPVTGTWRTFEPDDGLTGLADDPHAGKAALEVSVVRGVRGGNGTDALLPNAPEAVRAAVDTMSLLVELDEDLVSPELQESKNAQIAQNTAELGDQLVSTLRDGGLLAAIRDGTHPSSELHQAISRILLRDADAARAAPVPTAPLPPLPRAPAADHPAPHAVASTRHPAGHPAGVPAAVGGWDPGPTRQRVDVSLGPDRKSDKFDVAVDQREPHTLYAVQRDGQSEADHFWTGDHGQITHAQIHIPTTPLSNDPAEAGKVVDAEPDAHHLLGDVHYRFLDGFGAFDFRTDQHGKPVPDRAWSEPRHENEAAAVWFDGGLTVQLAAAPESPAAEKEFPDVKAFIDLQHRNPNPLQPMTRYTVEHMMSDGVMRKSTFWTDADKEITHVDTWSAIAKKAVLNVELGTKDTGLNRFGTAVKPNTVYRVNNRITYHTNEHGSPAYVHDERTAWTNPETGTKTEDKRNNGLQQRAAYVGLANSETAVKEVLKRSQVRHRDDETAEEVAARARLAAHAAVYLAHREQKVNAATRVVDDMLTRAFPAGVPKGAQKFLLDRLKYEAAEEEAPANAKKSKATPPAGITDRLIKDIVPQAQKAADELGLSVDKRWEAVRGPVEKILSGHYPEDFKAQTDDMLAKLNLTDTPDLVAVGEIADIGLHQRFPSAAYDGGHIVDAKSDGPKELVNYHPQYAHENRSGAWHNHENHLAALHKNGVKTLSYEVVASWGDDQAALHPTTPGHLTTRTVLEFGTPPHSKTAVVIRTFPNLPRPKPDPDPARATGARRKRNRQS